jgi:hypothetical protein
MCPGLTLNNLVVDSMHAADLGSFADALGSLFFLEIDNKRWYANRQVGLAALNTDLNKFYTANRRLGLSKVTPLAYNQLLGQVPGYPFLKAKAAQCRHLAEYGLILANRHRHGDAEHSKWAFKNTSQLREYSDEHGRLLVAMFQGMVRYVRSISTVPFIQQDCKEGMFTFLQSLSGLNKLWRIGLTERESKAMPFHLRPKSHALQHQVQDQIQYFGSPSQFWCYRDEDFVGAIKTMAAKTKHPFTLEQRLLEKLMILEGLGSYV